MYNDSSKLDWYTRRGDPRSRERTRGSLETGTAMILLVCSDGRERWHHLGGRRLNDWRDAAPQPFGAERATEIWESRGMQWDVAPYMTPGEDAYVNTIWQTMPGDTCWFDAFHRIRGGEVLP